MTRWCAHPTHLLLSLFPALLEHHNPRLLCEECVVLAKTDILTRVELEGGSIVTSGDSAPQTWHNKEGEKRSWVWN